MRETLSASQEQAVSADGLRAAFDGIAPYTVGLEEELMLLDPETFELLPVASEVLTLLRGDPRFKLELPASQLEILTCPTAAVSEAAAALLVARRELADRLAGRLLLGVAGAHPFSPGVGELNRHERYDHTIREFGPVAVRQLVCALQVHVSVGDADAALAVYNAARSYLPWVAALAANAPFYEGTDTGLASVRPLLAALLPRQGVPPGFPSWEAYAGALRWGAVSGAFPEVRTWWWELRLHPQFGTLEFRVPDGQTTVSDAAAVAAVIQALVVWLSERHAAGERLPLDPTWQIEENRWSACRYGLDGTMADLQTGMARSTRECVEELLEVLEPVALRLQSISSFSRARALARRNGAIAQRLVAKDGGAIAVARWLADRFGSDS